MQVDTNGEERRAPVRDEVPTTVLVDELFTELGRVLRAELRRLRETATQATKHGVAGGLLATMGGALLLVGTLVLAFDAVYLLAFVMPLWVSALIIGFGGLVTGGMLAFGGAKELKKTTTAAQEIAHTLEEDGRWARETLHEARKSRVNG